MFLFRGLSSAMEGSFLCFHNRITEYQKWIFGSHVVSIAEMVNPQSKVRQKIYYLSYLGYYVNIQVSLMFGHMFMVPCF